MKRFIIFLVRRRLKLKKYEKFQFANQKTNAIYFFDEYGVLKICDNYIVPSSVSLNWLLDEECIIVRY